MRIFGPVFPVEVTTTLRRTRYFVARIGYVVILGAALWLTYVTTFRVATLWGGGVDYQAMAQFANAFFSTFSLLQLLAVLAVTPAVVAGTIAEERSRGTIEHLFVTQLRNSEIVLGKLAARLVPILILLAGGLPILAIVMTLGGISPTLLAQSFVISGSTLACVTALSIYVSVRSEGARDAVTRTYALIFAALTLPPLLGGMIQSLGWGPFAVPQSLAPLVGDDALGLFLYSYNPLSVLTEATSAAWMGGGSGWWIVNRMVVVHLTLATTLVAMAVALVRRTHLSAKGRGANVAGRAARVHGRKPPGADGMLWKELYVEGQASRHRRVRKILFVLALLGVVAFVGWILFLDLSDPSSYIEPGVRYYGASSMLSLAIACLALLLVAARGATSVTLEKERDTWVSLLTTPLSPGEILRAKVLGSLFAIRWAVIMVAILWAPSLVLRYEPWITIALALPVYALLATFVSCLGVWFSLRSKNSVRAMSATIAICLLLGGCYLFCCIPMFMMGGPEDGYMLMFAPCMVYLLVAPGILADTLFSSYSYSDGTFLSLMTMSWFIGLAFYGVMILVLWQSMTGFFDEDTGRVRPRYRDDGRLPRLGEAPIAVEIVDEADDASAGYPRA